MRRLKFSCVRDRLAVMRSAFLVLAVTLVACNPSTAKDKGATPDGIASTTGATSAVLAPFSQLRAAGPVDVDVTVGKPQAIAVSCSDGGPTSRVSVRVDGARLVIDAPSKTRCKATVSTPALEATEVTGSGNVTVSGKATLAEASGGGSGDLVVETVETDTFTAHVTGSGELRVRSLTAKSAKIELRGSGDVDLAGKSNSVDVQASSSGSLRAKSLVADSVTANVTGSGDVALHATKKADVTLAGSGDATIAGNPPEKTKKVVGSGSLKFE